MQTTKSSKLVNKEDLSSLEERKQIQHEKFLKNVPARFQDAWIENCNEKIKEWAENVDYSQRKGVYIYGGVGTGKTYTLYALARNILFTTKLDSYYIRVENAVDLLRRFKDSFKEDYNLVREYMNFNGVLFIDDIGAEKSSEFVEETLYNLINNRYENQKITFFSSNLSLDEMSDKNGDRVVSRIAEMCDVINLNGKDKRIK